MRPFATIRGDSVIPAVSSSDERKTEQTAQGPKRPVTSGMAGRGGNFFLIISISPQLFLLARFSTSAARGERYGFCCDARLIISQVAEGSRVFPTLLLPSGALYIGPTTTPGYFHTAA